MVGVFLEICTELERKIWGPALLQSLVTVVYNLALYDMFLCVKALELGQQFQLMFIRWYYDNANGRSFQDWFSLRTFPHNFI